MPCSCGSPGPEALGYVGVTTFFVPWRIREGQHQACEQCSWESLLPHPEEKQPRWEKLHSSCRQAGLGDNWQQGWASWEQTASCSKSTVTLPVHPDTAPQPSSCPRTRVCHFHMGTLSQVPPPLGHVATPLNGSKNRGPQNKTNLFIGLSGSLHRVVCPLGHQSCSVF